MLTGDCETIVEKNWPQDHAGAALKKMPLAWTDAEKQVLQQTPQHHGGRWRPKRPKNVCKDHEKETGATAGFMYSWRKMKVEDGQIIILISVIPLILIY